MLMGAKASCLKSLDGVHQNRAILCSCCGDFLTVREPPPSPKNEETQTKTQTTENLNRQNSKYCKSVEKRKLRPWSEFPPRQKLRPWSELIAQMVMGVVPGLVNFCRSTTKSRCLRPQDARSPCLRPQDARSPCNQNR